jgi:hypothetical protein
MESFFPPPPRPYSAYAPIPARRRPSGVNDLPGGEPSEILRPLTAEREIEVARIARQLAAVARETPWERVQNDDWDRLSPFIFQLRTAARVYERAEQVATLHGLERPAFVNYALRRWYCFWGARLAELLFVGHPGVVPGPPKDREVDFTIDGVPFDLKTSDVPRAFANRIGDLHAQPDQLASWFYAHQSRERRFHAANRLFLVLCNAEEPDEAWRLRGDVAALRTAIDGFLVRRRYREIWVADATGARRRVLTAVIPVFRSAGPRQLTMRFPAAMAGSLDIMDVEADEPAGFQLGLPLG